MEKINLAELKKLIKHFKAHECPRLGQKKEVLMKFAVEHKLIGHREEAKEIAVEKHKNEVVKTEVPAKAKKVIKIKKEAVVVEPVKSSKDKSRERLQMVQKIRKEKGVSLKEAWAMLKN